MQIQTSSDISKSVPKPKAARPPVQTMLSRLAGTNRYATGEALALQWDDIDFEERCIFIQRTFSRGKIGLPKNGKRRRIDMSRQLTQVLKDAKHQRKIETINKGWGKVPKWVFVSNAGTPLDVNHWRKRIFTKPLKRRN